MRIKFQLDKEDESLRPVLKEAVKKFYSVMQDVHVDERRRRIHRACKTLAEKFLLDFSADETRCVLSSIPVVTRLTH